MLAYSAVGFKLSAVSPELTLSLTQLGALVGAGAKAFQLGTRPGAVIFCLRGRSLCFISRGFSTRTLGFPPVSGLVAAAAAAAVSALAGVRVDVSIVINFPAGAGGHAEPAGRCNSLYAGM